MRWHLTMLGWLAVAPLLAQPIPPTDESDDEAILREHHLPTQGAPLLQIVRERTPSPLIIHRFQELVTRLSADAYAIRRQATADLIRSGPILRPLVSHHLQAGKLDSETASRLKLVLQQFPADTEDAILSAAAHLLARDKPAGSLPVLLDFVPYVDDETLRQEMQQAINAVAFLNKKPHALILTALQEKDPARRAAAAEALVHGQGLAAKPLLAPRLQDAHPLVQYQLGMALIARHDKAGVPLLIRSLMGISAAQADYALERLAQVAGADQPTAIYLDKSHAAIVAAAWRKWYEQHEPSLDLAKALTNTEQGFVIIGCSSSKARAKNTVMELGPDHQPRWEFEGPRYPIDLQVLGANRLLIAEYFDRRVTERVFKGNILRQFPAAMPIACQRLANGQTFIATRQKVVILDRAGKEVFTWFQQNTTINTALRLRDGKIVLVTSGGHCQLLSPLGRTLKHFQIGPIYTLGGNIEVLPNGRILAPQYSQNCIAEFDWQGQTHWQAAIKRPISVTRLKNGHTLVTCSLDYRVVELDADGKEVWSYRTEGRPFRARPR